MDFKEIYIPIKGEMIQADLYGDFQHPTTIIMSHGLGGEKECGLHEFAQHYKSLGFNVCLFDHRGFGKSTGKVKHLVDKNSQIQDWQSVIDYLIQNHNINQKDMILWGYSFSGAHVLTLASRHQYKAIIANFPHVDGLASLTLYPKKFLIPASFNAIQDLGLSVFGKIKTMPVVASNRFAILAGEDCFDGYHSMIPNDMHWENAVPARIVATIGFYRPTQYAHKIQSPTLLLGAAHDSLIPIKATQKISKKIKNAHYIELNCGHFDLFHKPFKSEIFAQHENFLRQL